MPDMQQLISISIFGGPRTSLLWMNCSHPTGVLHLLVASSPRPLQPLSWRAPESVLGPNARVSLWPRSAAAKALQDIVPPAEDR